MAVKTGLLTSLTFNSNDISEDVLSMQLTSPNGMIDVSGIDLVGFTRIIGRRDCKLSLTMRVSDAVAGGHATLAAASSTSISASCVVVFGGKTATFHAIVENYDVSIGNGLEATATSTLSMDTGVALVWS